jgi:hypothetical protein
MSANQQEPRLDEEAYEQESRLEGHERESKPDKALEQQLNPDETLEQESDNMNALEAFENIRKLMIIMIIIIFIAIFIGAFLVTTGGLIVYFLCS